MKKKIKVECYYEEQLSPWPLVGLVLFFILNFICIMVSVYLRNFWLLGIIFGYMSSLLMILCNSSPDKVKVLRHREVQ